MSKKSTPGAWTPEEIAILIKTYPAKGTDACLALLPGRTKAAIATRAKKQNIRLNSESMRNVRVAASLKGAATIRRWDEELDKRLAEVYTKHGTLAACKALPWFNKRAIKNRAYQLGLRVNKCLFSAPIEVPDDWFELQPIKRTSPAGSWKADIPAIRSVFDLAEAV